jgi:3-hydroxyisobutyrate dehydrogenase
MTQAVTVLGTGIMGSGMARNLARAGLDVTVWNRSADKALSLADVGAAIADDPRSATAGADVVLTMLFDAEAVEQVMTEALPAAGRGTVWVQSSTVGLDATGRLAQLADRHDVGFVDAPILGTRQPAQEGTLTVLAGGPERLRDAVAPVFDAIGSRTIWAGEQPGDGHRLKLAANSWVLSVVAATAQAVALTRDLGLDPQQFLDVIAGGPLDSAYAQAKGRAMIAGEFPPAFPLDGAAKDSALIADAMRSAGTNDHLMAAMHELYAAAVEAGHGDEDMAAVVHAMAARS